MEKTIFIVGMGGGISYATALRFGHEGYSVGMIARNEATLAAYQELFDGDGIKTHYALADAGVQAELSSAFAQLKEKLGDPEVLLYNVAKVKDKNILRETTSSLAADFKVNVGGALHCVKEVLEAMKQYNRGTLLFTGGGLALTPNPNYGSLALGKAALVNLTLQLADELSYTNIKVGTVVVKGYVQAKDLKYNPTSIAEEFWKLHSQPGRDISVVEY